MIKSSVHKFKKVYNKVMGILDKKLQKQVRIASEKLGLNERDMINRAVSAYLGNIKEFTNLQKELRLWDVLSAQTMRKYKF